MPSSPSERYSETPPREPECPATPKVSGSGGCTIEREEVAVPSLVWQDLTREELNEVAPTAIAVLPVGAIEQHGPHLPTKTDTFVAEAITTLAATRVPEDVTAVILPAVPFGSSAHHIPFGGTLSLSQDTLNAVLMDLLRSCAACGFDRILMVNGHGGNAEVCGAIAKRAAVELDVLAAAVSYWTLLPPVADMPGHAGVFETSIMLALAPDDVRRHEIKDSNEQLPQMPYAGVVVDDPRRWKAMAGYTDVPSGADAARGRDWLELASSALAETIAVLARMERLPKLSS